MAAEISDSVEVNARKEEPVARTEEIDQVLEKHFPEGLEGAEPENFEQAEQELARLFKVSVKVRGRCTWDSRRPLGQKLECNIVLDIAAE